MAQSQQLGQQALPQQDDQHGIGEKQDQQHQRDRRGITEIEPPEGLGEDVAGDDLCSVRRAAAGHDDDEIGKIRDPNGAQHDGDGDRRRKER